MKKKMKGISCILLTLCTVLVFMPINVFAVSEIEDNNSFDTAQTISVNRFVRGNLTHGVALSANDVDYYKVDLPSAGYISPTFNHDDGDFPYSRLTSYWTVQLYNEDRKLLASYGFAGEETLGKKCESIGVSAGTYYLKVEEGFVLSEIPYELKLNYTESDSWEKEFNDSFKTATQIFMNSSINGNIASGDDIDYYKFDLPSARSISLTFNHDEVESDYEKIWADWIVTLYNENQKELTGYCFEGHEIIGEKHDPIDVSAGTYYVKVDRAGVRSSVKYELTIFDDSSSNLIFRDVSPKNYYYKPVMWAVEQGITSGIGKSTFGSNNSCTRAQAVTFLWKAAGSPKASDSDNPFIDVRRGDYYYDAVLWAVERGITNGTSDVTFSPDANCTRAQIVTLLYKMKGFSSVKRGNKFSDVSDNDYYSNAVKWAVDEGITSGTSNTMFSPDSVCTRAQIVTFLYHAMAK